MPGHGSWKNECEDHYMTTINLYDTASREKRELHPADGRTFRMYCCGPTVYGPSHIGNFRTFVIQDILRRTLESTGIAVRHIRNITDIDDKTIRESQSEGKSLAEFTRHWIGYFHKDSEALGLLPPHAEPSAVEHIPQQIALIEKLIDRGHAYATPDGSVYFRVDSFDSYGRLSRLHERHITTNDAASPAGVQDADEYDRESAADFALWKSHKPGDGPNKWPSPWGEGRPGWHLECSAMSLEYLGDNIDLHAGGVDLVFPHHENEIAQSEGATGRPFVRHWFHSTHLLVEGRKMSKSLGNLHTLEDVVKRGYNAMDLRYVLLSGYYRQALNFTWDSLNAARSALRRLQQLYRDLEKSGGEVETRAEDQSWCSFVKIIEAMADDLNTPKALGELFVAVHDLEKRLHSGEPDPEIAGRELEAFRRVLYLFGFELEESTADAPEEVRRLAEQRMEARKARDWSKADALRDSIEARGWSVRDAKDGFDLVPLE